MPHSDWIDVCLRVTNLRVLNVVLLTIFILQSAWIFYHDSPGGLIPLNSSNVLLTELKYTLSHPKNRSVRLVPSAKYQMLVMVMSNCTKEGRNARDTIRKTWMQTCHTKEPPCLVKFVMGTLGLPSSTVEDLELERKLNSDLLLLANLKDTPNHQTRKVLESFVWADQNVDFTYLLKTDHDSFVFVNELHKVCYQYHQEKMNRRLYWGNFVINGEVRRFDVKWAESNWFLSDHYLPYAYGGGYMISADLIRMIAITADYLQLYNNEDVSVGVWLSPYLIQRKHDERFRTMPGGGAMCGTNDCLVRTSVSLDTMLTTHSNVS